MSEIQLFEVEGHRIRFGATDDGTPYAVAADYAKAMAYRDAYNALRLLDDGEKGTQIVSTPGGPQKVSVIYEDGLWELIFRSTLPGAKQIKARVKAILREIRETGRYGGKQPRLPQSYAEALRELASTVEERDAARAALQVAGPKAEAWDVLAGSEGDYSVRQAAYILNRDPAIDTGQNRLFRKLRDFGLLDRNDIPYAAHSRHVRLRASTFWHEGYGEWRTTNQVRLTAEGIKYLHRRLGGAAPPRFDGPLPLTG